LRGKILNKKDDLNFVTPSVNGKEVCKDQEENFIQDIKNLFSRKLFPDVVFEVEGEEIPAHKAILAYRSGYFMKMFTSKRVNFEGNILREIGGMSESHSAKISIPHMKSHIFKGTFWVKRILMIIAILQYIYCNEVELDEKLALDLIPVVDEYVMKGLKGVCEKYLCKQLRKENVVDMLIVADRHEIDELKKACFKFILKNLGNIDENEEMMKLSKSLFFELLKFQTLGQQSNIFLKKRKLIYFKRK